MWKLRRGRFEILRDMLLLAYHTSSKTALTYHVGGHRSRRHYLQLALKAGLIVPLDNSGKFTYYETTEKGRNFIAYMDKLEQLV